MNCLEMFLKAQIQIFINVISFLKKLVLVSPLIRQFYILCIVLSWTEDTTSLMWYSCQKCIT